MKAGDTVMYVDLLGENMFPYIPMVIERIDGNYYSFKFNRSGKTEYMSKEIKDKNFLKSVIGNN